MDKRLIFLLMAGAIAAGCVFLIVGAVVYLTGSSRVLSVVFGIIIMAIGVIMIGAAAIIMLVMLLIVKLRQRHVKKKQASLARPFEDEGESSDK